MKASGPLYFWKILSIENCHNLFNGCQILDVVPFRLTRDSDLDVDEDDIDNLLKEVGEISA